MEKYCKVCGHTIENCTCNKEEHYEPVHVKTKPMIIIILILLACLCVFLNFSCTGDKTSVETEEKNTKNQMGVENISATNNSSGGIKQTEDEVYQNESLFIKQDEASLKESANGLTGTPNKGSDKENELKVPSHTHNWVAVYSERDVYEDVPIYGQMCIGCGATFQGGVAGHCQEDPFDDCRQYKTGVVIGYEKIYSGTESYVSGYKCSCGATK